MHVVCRSLPGAQGAVGEGCSLISAGCVPLLLLTQGPGWRLVSAPCLVFSSKPDFPGSERKAVELFVMQKR